MLILRNHLKFRTQIVKNENNINWFYYTQKIIIWIFTQKIHTETDNDLKFHAKDFCSFYDITVEITEKFEFSRLNFEKWENVDFAQ